MRTLAGCLALAFALSVTGVQPALADTDDAKAHYQKGRKLYEQKQYDEALVELRASEAGLESPNTTLLIAHALRDKGDRVAALVEYRRAMSDADRRVRAGETRFRPTLEEAERSVAALALELGKVTLRVRGSRPGTTVSVDGRETGSASATGSVFEVQLDHEPGKLTVEARAKDGAVARREASVAAGEAAVVELELPAPPGPRVSRPRLPPVPTMVLGGVGAAGLTVFAVFGAMSLGVKGDLAACAKTAAKCPRSPENLDLVSKGKAYQTVANVALTVGALSVATAATLWIALPSEPRGAPAPAAPPVALGVSAGRVVLRGAF